jgi:predicted nucleic acid-binding protein
LIFLDTNVVSEIVRPIPNPKVIDWLVKHDAALVLSTIVLAEITYGIERLRPDERAKRLEGFPAELQRRYSGKLYSLDAESALLYGVLMGHSRRRGHVLSTADGMIAAVALRHKAALATRNTADFVLPNLKLHNPWD